MGYTGRIDVSQFWAGVTAPSIMFGAYATEVFRMAIQDIPKGQWESAQSIGMTPTQTLTRIILPQMWMVALPGLGNLTLVLLKDTALVSVDWFTRFNVFCTACSTIHPKPFTFYLAAAFIYLALTSVITLLSCGVNLMPTLPHFGMPSYFTNAQGVNHELELASNY